MFIPQRYADIGTTLRNAQSGPWPWADAPGCEEAGAAPPAVITTKADLFVLESHLIRRVAGLVAAASVAVVATVAPTPSIVQPVAFVRLGDVAQIQPSQ